MEALDKLFCFVWVVGEIAIICLVMFDYVVKSTNRSAHDQGEINCLYFLMAVIWPVFLLIVGVFGVLWVFVKLLMFTLQAVWWVYLSILRRE